MKVFQMRKNYNPSVTEETRELILNRKALQEEAAKKMQVINEGI